MALLVANRFLLAMRLFIMLALASAPASADTHATPLALDTAFAAALEAKILRRVDERVHALEAKIDTLQKENEALRQRVDMHGGGAGRQHVSVDAAGVQPAAASDPAPRRLSSSSSGATFVSVGSRQVHEFPSGHTCGAVSGLMKALPTTSSGAVSCGTPRRPT